MNRHLLFGKYICWLFWKMNPRICIKIFEHIFQCECESTNTICTHILLSWYGSRHQATEVPLFQCSARLTRLSAVSNENSDFFSDQIRHFESQFGNMDDLLLTFAYNVKTTHFQPSSNKVLQPRKRWDVLCRIIREC